jgi:hypothetical protein
LDNFQNKPIKQCKRLRHVKQEIRREGALLNQQQKKHAKSNKALETYFREIEDMPTYTCVLCERLHFKKDISLLDNIFLSSFASLPPGVDPTSLGKNDQICKTCSNAILNEKLPPFISPLHIHRN